MPADEAQEALAEAAQPLTSETVARALRLWATDVDDGRNLDDVGRESLAAWLRYAADRLALPSHSEQENG